MRSTPVALTAATRVLVGAFAVCLGGVYPGCARAQVVNIEQLRLDSRQPGYTGSAGGNLDLQRNQRSVFNFGTFANVQYRRDSNLVFFVSQTGIVKASGSNFVNFAFGHLRYTRSLLPQLALEAFGQLQQNRVNGIRSRGLLGAGVRTRLFDAPGGSGYFGFLVVQEREREVVDSIPIHRDTRVSTYFAGSYTPETAEWITVASTTYLQPRIGRFADLRIASDWQLQIRLRQNLSLTTTLNVVYDAEPPVGLEKTVYALRNGLKWVFR